MKIAIGLPNAVPGTTGEQLTEWAKGAEPLIASSAVAAVTERIGLATDAAGL